MSNKEIARLVEEDHKRLRAQEAALESELKRDLTSADFQEWRRALLRELRDFQYHLLKHFDLEEDGGFMADLIAHVPRMSGPIAALEEEHVELIAVLDAIVSEFKRIESLSQWRVSDLPSRIMSLLGALREHEAAECSLIQEAYYQDIGVAD